MALVMSTDRQLGLALAVQSAASLAFPTVAPPTAMIAGPLDPLSWLGRVRLVSLGRPSLM